MDHILVVGLTSVAVAKKAGLTVLATTRSEKKKQALLDAGADHVLIDDGNIAEKVRTIFPKGVDRIQELVGTRTLLDSLQLTSSSHILKSLRLLRPEIMVRSSRRIVRAWSIVALATSATSRKLRSVCMVICGILMPIIPGRRIVCCTTLLV
ncbi:MAG: zinc-binding dehydrogenase [Chloroflexi bacterium]|nr:MAG: zinc-binding dehydrogenase [Chloroflexota bacterium]